MVIFNTEFKKRWDSYTAEIIANIVPYVEHLYAVNDPAHRIDHVTRVSECASDITWRLAKSGMLPDEYTDIHGLLELQSLVVTAAMYHDIFSSLNRREHHELAKEYIMTKPDLPLCHSDKNRLIMGLAAQQHRASWKGAYSHIACEIVAAADRGVPCVDSYVMRSILYGNTIKKFDVVDSMIHGLSHIGAKFGSVNKTAVPSWYDEMFHQEITESAAMFALCHETIFTRENVMGFIEQHFDPKGAVRTWIQQNVLVFTA